MMFQNKLKKFKLKDEHMLGCALITLPISLKINSIALIIASAYFVYCFLKKNRYEGLIIYTTSFLFFLAQAGSFLLSENIEVASHRLSVFLSFILFPFFFTYLRSLKEILRIQIFDFLFYGTVAILIYGVVRFSYDVTFLNERFDHGRGIHLFLRYVPHHVYLSMFMLINIYSLIDNYFRHKNYKYLLFVPPLYLGLILLSSRMAILVSVIILPTILFFRYMRTPELKEYKRYILPTIAFMTTLGFTNEFARDKVVHTYYEVMGIQTKEKTFHGVSDRKIIWKSAIKLIKQSPWVGYGIGDIQETMNKDFKQNGHEHVIDYNAHNQYLQFALHHGILIASLLLAIIINLIRKLIINKHSFLVFCWFILLSFSMTETILNRQWGVVLFAFILNYSIYVLSFSTKEVSRI